VISSINDQPGEAADVMVVAVSLIGWTKAPLPAESYTANAPIFSRDVARNLEPVRAEGRSHRQIYSRFRVS
jgi:hypothetical protein